MKKKIKCLISVLLAMLQVLLCSMTSVYGDTVTSSDPVIMVSLGDSYSSGEGIPPFYGQKANASKKEKAKDEDWLAHRSTKSWPSLLKIPGISGTMGNYKVGNIHTPATCEWYFKASSGAKTEHINTKKQDKEVKELLDNDTFYFDTLYLPKQLDVFNDINSSVDYVTLTVGGNDVDFAGIIKKCIGSTYLHFTGLNNKISKLWENFSVTKANIKKTYQDIATAAGPQATIIVAGYPQLLDKDGKGALISKEEATTIDENVSKFNRKLQEIVEECYISGIDIVFVDVEKEFDGHQAYSDDSWINPIMPKPQSEDLTNDPGSSYSVHPNEAGAKAYARCVNAKIEEVANRKKTGTLSGKICKASDRTSPVDNATISVYKDNKLFTSVALDDINGNYSLKLPVGEYSVEIKADGYIPFKALASVAENENTYMETFLLVEGEEGETGIATGKISNALTGKGIEGVSLSIRNGWNNSEYGDIIESAVTDADGNYSVTLPLGNYTIFAEKDGYISGTFNIIVQSGTTDSQNGTITPRGLGNNFRIVLTWGENPRDLDSHVVGTLSNGDNFHVYYNANYRYDGDIEVCNLDVDDKNSYGPETITLNTNTSEPYYYYICRFDGKGTVGTSEAQVRVYQNDTLIAKYNVPTDQGNGDYWNVFAIVNGELITRNTITDNSDLTYAYNSEDIAPNAMSLDTQIVDNEPKKEDTFSDQEAITEDLFSDEAIAADSFSDDLSLNEAFTTE